MRLVVFARVGTVRRGSVGMCSTGGLGAWRVGPMRTGSVQCALALCSVCVEARVAVWFALGGDGGCRGRTA